jgi:F0F1-type ATP synthase assembly protein I
MMHNTPGFQKGGRLPSDHARQGWLRFVAKGTELGATIAVPAILGEWLDRRQGTAPWGLLVGFFFGLSAGLYLFIRSSLKAMREAENDDDLEGDRETAAQDAQRSNDKGERT